MPVYTADEFDKLYGSRGSTLTQPTRQQFGWGDRLGAAVDSAQAGLYGIGEAVGSEWAGEQRRRNQVEADYTRARAAQDTGAPTSYKDVNSVGGAARYVGGLLVDSAPQLVTSAAAGAVAGPLGLTGTAGRLFAAGVAGYPMAVGDILQNQREESGRTDLGSAAALAVPYAAADLMGVEGALARGALTRNAIRRLDDINGLKGGLARAGVSMAKTGLAEGAGETLQEVTNQLGRMAVNPNASLFSDEALDRYGESFVGGAAMGGAFGTVGGWRRSGLPTPTKTVDQGSTDLLNTPASAPAAPPLQLGFKGYDTGVGELVTMADGSTMLRSDYDAMQRTGRRPDGSFNFVPVAPSDVASQRGAPYQYEGGIPFTPTDLPAPEARQGGLRMPVGAPGAQANLFGSPLDEAPNETPLPPEDVAPLRPRDTATRDMLQENPSAMVPTMFNPAQPPAPVAVSAASSARGQSIGAVAMNLRSRLVQQGAAADGFTTKLALDISQRLHSLENLQEYVQLQETELEKAQAKLDRKVTGGSNMLTPDEYAAERAKIEDRRFALEAAKELVQEYQRGRTNALAQEAAGRARPGAQVGASPRSRVAERTMRDQNMAGAVAENDQRVAENAVARTEQARMAILRQVMSQPARGSAVARVRDALRAAGYTNMDLSDQEMAELRRLGQRRADVRAATVVPPGLAAARGRLTPRASLEETNADIGEPAAASLASAPADAPVQLAGGERDAGLQPAQPAPAPAVEPPAPGAQAAPAVPADGEPDGALDGVTSEALVEAADDAKDAQSYEAALDELYRRWRDDGDRVAEKFFEDNAKVRGFAADYARVRERAGESAPAPKSREGRRGMRPGPVETGKLDDSAKETDALLRGLASLKWQTRDRPATGGANIDGVLREVARAVPGARIEVFDSPQAAGLPAPPGGATAMGVTLNDGRILLFRNGLDSSMEALRTAFHELFHKGLRNLLPEAEYHRMMDALYAADPEVQRRAHEWGRSDEAQARQAAGMSNRELRSLAIEEALADLAEDLKTAKPGTIRAVANWMATVAERLGMTELAQWLRRAPLTEAQRFIEDALQVAGDPGPRGGGEFAPLAQRRAEAFKVVEPPKFDRADPLGSAAFKKWFGDSKVVDAQGRPLVVYHGSRADISEFKSQADIQQQKDSEWRYGNEGIYFASNREIANAYGRNGTNTLKESTVTNDGAVYPVYLQVRNPLVVGDGARFDPNSLKGRIAKMFAPKQFAHAAAVQDLRDRMGDSGTFISAQDRAELERMGYDGVLSKSAHRSSDVWIVFRPEQIKSATGNNGAFSASNPDIRYKTKPADQAVADSFAKVPYANTTIGRSIQDALYNIAQSPWALPWTTNDQIAEGYKHIKPVLDINRATGRMAATANRYMEAAAQTAKRWRALDDDVQLAMQRVMLQSTMDESHVSIKDADGKTYLSADAAWKHPSNAHLEKTPTARAKFGKLYQEFHALPAAAKVVYDQVRQDLETQHQDMLAALRKGVADQYAGQLRRQLTAEELTRLASEPADVRRVFKDMMSVAGTRAEMRALEHMYQALRDINSEFGTVRGPYFPLVRFGNHVVVMKSADLQALEDQTAAKRTELQTAMDEAPPASDPTAEAHDAKIAELRDQYNRLLEAVNATKQDETKYVVEFHETPAEAERARLELERKNPAATVRKTVRENYYRALEGASPAFLKDLTQTLSAALDSGDGVTSQAKATALQAMKDMYLRRQPERSALRAELKRMGIEGVKAAQMLRGYAQATRNGAWRISRLTHAGEVMEGLAALSEDRYNADAKHVLNELKARFVGDLVPPEESKVLQTLQNTTYFMHLGFNVSYFVTNATQAWTTSLPVMAGRHGVVNAANSLAAASKDVIRLLSQATAESVQENGKLVGLQLRLTDEQIRKLAKDDGEARMLKALTDDGVIDITIKHDLGAISDGAATSTVGRGLQKTMELSSALANYPELYNRLSTALAAYRMEVAKRDGGPETSEQVQERAEAYAENVINRTHFNYSPENAPRMMRSQLGRLVFQFKRYQQGMIYLFAKLIKDATNGDADARRSLAYLLGMTTAVGGVVSLPIAAPIALAAKVLASAYPDDDEPEWLQQWYNGMKDSVGEGVAQALVKGLPTVTGLDLSGKLGQGNLLNPVAFANTDGKKFFSRDYFMAAGFGLLGPSASLVANEAEAVGYLQNGDILKAAERGMPVFAANAIKAYRRSQDGLTTKAGDTLMEPEEFSALSNVLKAAGFESVKVSDTYDNRSAYMNMLTGRQDARKALLRSYYEAVKSGDAEAQAEAKQAIAEFNQRQPADKVKPADLAASIKQHANRAKETVGGLRVGKRDTDTYRQLMGEE